MAIRRARIKPVISLPPRRKHNNAGNNTKTLETQSPQTSQDTIASQDDLYRDTPRTGSPLKSPLPVANIMFEYHDEEAPSPISQAGNQECSVTPKISEMVWFSSDHNEFVPPSNARSLNRMLVVSPLVQHSRAELNVPSLPPVAPENIPEMPKQKSADKRPAETNITDSKSKRAKKNVTCTIVSSDVPDDNMASNTEGSTEQHHESSIMDGIVPLQASSASMPLAKLKKAIISENAEVLFDPIVPLPSTSKVRAKLRPVPRLLPLQRNSMQGSTSESEDESRRVLLSACGPSSSASRQRCDSISSVSTVNAQPFSFRGVSRVRYDSVSSTVSQTPTLSALASSPQKDKHASKSQRVAGARRAAALRRRTQPGPKDTLTMYDLIFYNPSTNPIVPDNDEVKAKEANAEEVRKAAEEIKGKSENKKVDPAPVPQIKLGPNGEIVLDQQSLVINQSEKRSLSPRVVREGAWSSAATGRYRRAPRTKAWSDAETVRFYRALAALGTDFMLMENLFPGRTRKDLRLKFKREERVNMAQIDKALRASCKWDVTSLMEEFATERAREGEAAQALAAQQEALAQQRQRDKLNRVRARASRASKALDTSVLPPKHSGFTANDIIEQYQLAKASKKKEAQKPRKRGRPKTKLSPPTATVTQDTPTTQPTAEVATARNIVSPEPQDKMPDERPNMPRLPANIQDGSLVVITVDDPNAPSKKMLQTYIASGGGRLTAVNLSHAVKNTVVAYIRSTQNKGRSSPHLTSSSSEHEASQDGPPSSTLPSTYAITQL